MEQTVFHYDPGLPSERDWVRFYVGATNMDQPEIDDREIDALLAEEAEPATDELTGEEPTADDWRAYRKLVASRAAEAIAAKYAREADVSFENQRTSLSAKFAQYQKLAQRLKAEAHSAKPLKVERW